MAVRVVVAVVLFAVLAAVAWWLERRRRVDAPTQDPTAIPAQLDRHDFPRPDLPWLVVLFTSNACDSCAGLIDKASPLQGDEVAVVEVEYTVRKDLHERYHVQGVPLTLVADADGVVIAHFLGAFAAAELWAAVPSRRT